MKLRIVFEVERGERFAKAIELEGEKLKVTPSNGWLIILDGDRFVVGYPPGVIRSVGNVGAFNAVVVKPSEDPERRQQTRQGTAA